MEKRKFNLFYIYKFTSDFLIKNAVEYSTAQYIEKIKNDNKELYFTDKGELLRSDLLSHEQ